MFVSPVCSPCSWVSTWLICSAEAKAAAAPAPAASNQPGLVRGQANKPSDCGVLCLMAVWQTSPQLNVESNRFPVYPWQQLPLEHLGWRWRPTRLEHWELKLWQPMVMASRAACCCSSSGDEARGELSGRRGITGAQTCPAAESLNTQGWPEACSALIPACRKLPECWPSAGRSPTAHWASAALGWD